MKTTYISLLAILVLASCAPQTENLDENPREPSHEMNNMEDETMMEENAMKAEDDSTIMKEGEGEMEDAMMDNMDTETASYINAVDNISIANEAIGNGNSALLFFYAAWCPYCQAKDAEIKELYSNDTFQISTYKINFDTADTLKARYGVSMQDTVVLIDGEGNSQQVILGATKDDLRILLLQ